MASPGEIRLRHTASELIDAIATPAGRDFDSAWTEACKVFGRFGAIPAEEAFLAASPIACAVADAWQDFKNRKGESPPIQDPVEAALNDLELATRESPLRKVRP